MALTRPVEQVAPAPGSSYELLAPLPLVVDSYRLERREQPTSSGWTRVTTTIVIDGGGVTGRGEDVTYDDTDHDALAAAPLLPLAGATTLDGFSRRLDQLELFARPPQRDASRDFRRWAFESAALDLALRQAGVSLGDALGRSYQPVRFIVSTRLDARRWLALDPTIELKLDPTPDWDDAYIDALAASGRVRVLDFKGHNVGGKVCQPPNPDLYRRIATRFPDAIIEDPVLTPATLAALAGAESRISWDAPIHSLDDVDALPFPPRYLNIKPSRFGTTAALLRCVEACLARGITLYGGGQYELGAGRDQIQALASLYYPDGPNDTAPREYNEPTPRAGLEHSPLPPPAPQRGF